MPQELLAGLARDVSDALFERYETHVASLGADGVLALVEGGTRERWLARLESAGEPRGQDRVLTPVAWAARELGVWWPVVEAGLEADGRARDPGVPPEPLLVRSDVAQALLGHFTRPFRERSRAFAQARTPPALLRVQIMDALTHAIEQGLDLPDAAARLVAGCTRASDEDLRREALPCLEAWRDGMLATRILDQGLAWWALSRYLLPSAAFRSHVARTCRALVVEDADEAPPLRASVVGDLARLAERVAVGWRLDRGVRDRAGAAARTPQEAWPDAIVRWLPARRAGLAATGLALAERLWPGGGGHEGGAEGGTAGGTAGHAGALRVIGPSAAVEGLVLVTCRTFTDMLDQAAADAAEAAEAGDAVAILVPTMSPLAAWWLRERLEARGLALDVTAGTSRLTDRPAVAAALALLDAAAHPPGDPEGLPGLLWHDVLALAGGDAARIRDALDRARTARSLAGLARVLCGAMLAWPPAPGQHERRRAVLRRAGELAGLVAAAERFEEADRRLGGRWFDRGGEDGQEGGQEAETGLLAGLAGLAGPAARFGAFMHSGGFAARPPAFGPAPRPAVTLATAGTYAARGYAVAVQLWLDAAAADWWKSDERELHNPRVLRRGRPPGPYGPAEDRRDTDEKLARILVACAARADRRIRAYASLLDAEGREHGGGLADLLAEVARTPAAAARGEGR